MTAQKYSDQDVLEAYRSSNLNLTHAAKLLGASRQTVANSLARIGVRLPLQQKNKRVHIDRQTLLSLYVDSRMSTSEIAAHLAVSAEAVRDQMIRHNIPRRPHGAPCGDKNQSWIGGRILDKGGYVLVLAPGHPNATKNGRIREHRLVMSEQLGRPLLDDEVVHHIDGNRQNNSPDNLVLFDKNGLHLRHELSGRVPSWTPAGLERMAVAGIEGIRKSSWVVWTDARKEKARQRTLDRHANGGFGPSTWTDESHRRISEFAKNRTDLQRRTDGTFAPKPKSSDQG